MQDKIKELEQEIARMQKTIQELKEQVPPTAAVLQKDTQGVFVGTFEYDGKYTNRLILKDYGSEECSIVYLDEPHMTSTADLDFVNKAYSPKKLTDTQLEALDRVVGRILNGTIM